MRLSPLWISGQSKSSAGHPRIPLHLPRFHGERMAKHVDAGLPLLGREAELPGPGTEMEPPGGKRS